jgi:energy-coupling factor transporter ATP-binding protein EcfA2
MDDALLDVILGRIDGDSVLSEGAKDLLLAACQGDDSLADAIGGGPPPRPRRVGTATSDSGGTGTGPVPAPVGAYLASITVEGFRGIGPAQMLAFQPGPGLTVVAGRNGSGKSSFAEGLEVLLTGSIPRFETYAVFRDGWRNLHHGRPARVRAEFHVEGAPGTTVVERSWADDAQLGDSACTVQITGEKKSPGLHRLGWGDHLTTYRPFLAHADLEAMFNAKPSDLYDRLAAVLGLGDLTATQDRLAARRKALETTVKASEAERKGIVDLLGTVDDERATVVRAFVGTKEPDLDAVARLVVGPGAPSPGGVVNTLRQLTGLTPLDPATTTAAAQRLRQAALGLERVAGTGAGRARSLAELLRRAVNLHDQHPDDTDCPVCGRSAALDQAWREHALTEIERLQGEAAAADQAHDEASAAIRQATAFIAPLPAVLRQPAPAGVSTDELVANWSTWAAPPDVCGDEPDDLRALADHLGLASEVATEVEQVRKVASTELAEREDRWSPVAQRVAAWIDQGRAAADASPTIALLRKTESWLKDAHDDIRNERLRPIAERAQATWRTLRHESNVDLGAIRLTGSSTRRRLELDATVDGSGTNALGVMSQGEVNALALSVFLPRAMLAESPFRFLVIDDPVQAMDPAKVDGLAHALHDAARTHQVVVFTHDDRLPNALRRLDLDARIVQVQRRPGSIVEIVPAGDPVSRALSDARAVARDERVPAHVKQRVVPGLCRLALEAALADITVRRELAAGRPHHEVDDLLTAARTLHQKAALAMFGGIDEGNGVLPRLATLGARHPKTFKDLNAGAHGQLTGSPGDTVKDTGLLVEALQEAFG